MSPNVADTDEDSAWSGPWGQWAAKCVEELKAESFQADGGVWQCARRVCESFAGTTTQEPFDVVPGVSAEAVVMLYVCGGKIKHGDNKSVESHPEDVASSNDYARSIGIASTDTWARSLVDAAVAFTEHAPPSAKATVYLALRGTWHRVLQRHPTLLEGRPDLEVRLMRALHGDFHHPFPVSNNPTNTSPLRTTESLLGKVFRGLPSFSSFEGAFTLVERNDLESMNYPARPLALEVGLLMESPAWLEEVARALQADELAPDEVGRVQKWVDLRTHQVDMPSPQPFVSGELLKAFEAILKAKRLEMSWEDSPVQSARRPRM